MLVLAIDTATPTLVAGVARWSGTPDGAEVLAERAEDAGREAGVRYAESYRRLRFG